MLNAEATARGAVAAVDCALAAIAWPV